MLLIVRSIHDVIWLTTQFCLDLWSDANPSSAYARRPWRDAFSRPLISQLVFEAGRITYAFKKTDEYAIWIVTGMQTWVIWDSISEFISPYSHVAPERTAVDLAGMDKSIELSRANLLWKPWISIDSPGMVYFSHQCIFIESTVIQPFTWLFILHEKFQRRVEHLIPSGTMKRVCRNSSS